MHSMYIFIIVYSYMYVCMYVCRGNRCWYRGLCRWRCFQRLRFDLSNSSCISAITYWIAWICIVCICICTLCMDICMYMYCMHVCIYMYCIYVCMYVLRKYDSWTNVYMYICNVWVHTLCFCRNVVLNPCNFRAIDICKFLRTVRSTAALEDSRPAAANSFSFLS